MDAPVDTTPASASERDAGAGRRGLRRLALLLLTVVSFAVYSNSFDHVFVLDSTHTISENPAIRNLARVPDYFTDAGTFTWLRANVDYRPVLVTTYALNYALSGYEMWSWHAVQIVLHILCAYGLYAFCRIILRRAAPELPATGEHVVALVPALLFAVHPTGAGVVNYLSARSSLLTAVFLLGALLVHARAALRPARARDAWLTALLFGLAIFTKVEAVALLGVLLLFDVWLTALERDEPASFFADLWATLGRKTLARIGPSVLVAGIYFVIRALMMAEYPLAESSGRDGLTPIQSLATQFVAWWFYVKQWFAPVGLVADNAVFPDQLSLFSGPALLAGGCWLALFVFLLTQWKRRPHLLFLALSALALISPTSSILALSERVNEHRPYLPRAIFSMVWVIPIALAVRARFLLRPARAAVALVAFGALIGVLASMTFVRNQVFASPEAYWLDVVEKAPAFRSHNNYALTLMARGDYVGAKPHIEKSLGFSPTWHIAHINMGIIQDRLGDPAKARQHFDLAVANDIFSGNGLTHRGRFLLKQQEFEAARADFQASIDAGSLDAYRNNKGLAEAYAGLGEPEKSFEATKVCLDLDWQQTQPAILAIVQPYFEQDGLEEAGYRYFELLREVQPDTWWVHRNLSTLAYRLGWEQRGLEHRQESDRLQAAEAQGT
jgi:tetratricopeptide (TPR) repeat protein